MNKLENGKLKHRSMWFYMSSCLSNT